MKLQGVYNKELISLLNSNNDIESLLDQIISTIVEANQYDTSFYSDDLLWECSVQNMNFATWIYDYTSYRDLKKELSKKIGKACSILPDATNNELLKETDILEKNIFILGENKKLNIFYQVDNYYTFKRFILSDNKTKHAFLTDLDECFPRIFFDNVGSSMNSLNNEFNLMKKDIVFHLTKLNDFNELFLDYKRDKMDNNNLCLKFKAFSGINCSPQAGRDGTKGLKREYPLDENYNSDNTKTKVLCCELHTKFTTHNRNREEQDRIYFHPGDCQIKNGKTIIIHIGKHL